MAALARAWRVLALLALLAGAAPTVAQDGSSPSVLIIDPDRLFSETLYGQRARREIEARAAALSAENRRIEAELVAEERELTEQRATLSVEEFRALADAFDVKVDRIRAEQDAKTTEVQRLSEIAQQRFFGQIGGILSRLVQERGAAVLLDRRTVFLAIESVDITGEAIARIDAALGEGDPLPAAERQPSDD